MLFIGTGILRIFLFVSNNVDLGKTKIYRIMYNLSIYMIFVVVIFIICYLYNLSWYPHDRSTKELRIQAAKDLRITLKDSFNIK